MKSFFKFGSWIWRSWPVFIIAVLLYIHLLLLEIYRINEQIINESISLVAQIIGGLLVLYSIDSNIGIIKKNSLIGVFVNYLKEFPLIKRNVRLNIDSAIHVHTSSNASLSVNRNPKTIDEKIDWLQEQINELKKSVATKENVIIEKMESLSKEMTEGINETKNEIGHVKKQIEDVSVGGVKVQIFGVLLIIYGSVSGFIA